MTLDEIIADIVDQTILIDGAVAELTRLAYYEQYDNYINTGQYVPILNYNINDTSIYINTTDEINIIYSDITTATDWICLNTKVVV